ncbi:MULTISPECIES: hypothetical protein [Streptomyces]|nr:MULTISPECIES: hypothetical protein [Streptomyces]
MNLNDAVQNLEVDALLALAESDEDMSVESLAPTRINVKYALLQDNEG